MKSNNLPGLTPAAILSFSVVLALLLGAGIPLAVTPEPVKLSDWLGFFGTLIGALVAFGAAYLAWRAVQDQIEVQRKIAERQSALQTYEILQRLAATLEDEIRLAMALNNVVNMITTIDRFKEQGPLNPLIAGILFSTYKSVQEQLKQVRHEWAIADTKRWQFIDASEARLDFEGTIVDLEQLLGPTVVQFKTMVGADLGDPVKAVDIAKKLNAITFDKLAAKARAARIVYTTAINGEFARLLPKLRLAKETAKL